MLVSNSYFLYCKRLFRFFKPISLIEFLKFIYFGHLPCQLYVLHICFHSSWLLFFFFSRYVFSPFKWRSHLHFNVTTFFILFNYVLYFWYLFDGSFSTTRSQKFSPISYFKTFIILPFPSRFLNHLNLVLVCGMRPVV